LEKTRANLGVLSIGPPPPPPPQAITESFLPLSLRLSSLYVGTGCLCKADDRWVGLKPNKTTAKKCKPPPIDFIVPS
jgi:hypothetical protein